MTTRRRSPAALAAAAFPIVMICACAGAPPRQDGARAVDAAARGQSAYELERYLNIRGHAFAGFSHDGKFAYYLSGVTGTAQLWRIAAEGGWPEQITFFADRVMFASPSPAGGRLIIGRDTGGDENTQLFLVSGDGGVIINLTNAPDVKHDFGGWSWDGKLISYSSNARTQKDVRAWRASAKDGKPAGDEPPTSTDVYVLEIGGAASCVHQAGPGELYSSAGFSPDGLKLLLSRNNGSLDNDLFVLDLKDNKTRHLTPHKEPTHYEADWAADGRSLWVVHNESREYYGLFRWDLDSEKREVVYTPDAEVESATPSRDGRHVIIASARDGGRHIELMDARSSRRRALAMGAGLPGNFDFMEGSSNIGYVMNGPRDPSDVYIYDHETDTTKRITSAFLAGIPRESFAEPQAIRYTSFDGLKIEALLWRPEGKGPHPTIVDFHGGPEGQHRPGFNSLAQYLVSRGFAVFQPNVRGSTGYGRKFGRLDDVRNREHSVRDGAAGVEWLKANGIADRKRIAAYGGSYGGYMVLASLTLFPDMWAAGVDIVGIANFVTFLENTSGYRRRLRESEYGVAGTAAAPGADREFLTQISPLRRVKDIKCPLLVIHGEKDPRVPVGEARQIEAALKELARPVESLYYPDEGHGIAKLKNRLDCYPKMVDFLNRHLGKQPPKM